MKFKKLFMASLIAMASLGANAGNYTLTGLLPGPLENPGSFTVTLNSPVADTAATLNFVLTGYGTLDGHNLWEDVLTLTINDVEIASGSFNLGGGGTSDQTFGTGSAVTKNHKDKDPGMNNGGQGGKTTVTGLTFNLLPGINTFKFEYSAIGPNNHGGQGLNDEGWGIASASVNTEVPESQNLQ